MIRTTASWNHTTIPRCRWSIPCHDAIAVVRYIVLFFLPINFMSFIEVFRDPKVMRDIKVIKVVSTVIRMFSRVNKMVIRRTSIL